MCASGTPVEDFAHFLIAQLGGGRFGDRTILSAQGIADMQRPAQPFADGSGFQAMGWDSVTTIGDVPVIVKGGSSVNFSAMAILLPERQLGLVLLVNANKGLDTSLGDQRLAMLPYNVAEMLLGQQPTAFPADVKPPLFYAILFLAVALQVAGMARTVFLLRRWRRQPNLRPQASTRLVVRRGLAVLCNLGWSLVALVGVPALFQAQLSHISYMAPDFGTTLLVSGVVALAWSVVRSVVLWRGLRIARAEPAVVIGTPAKA